MEAWQCVLTKPGNRMPPCKSTRASQAPVNSPSPTAAIFAPSVSSQPSR